VQTKSPDRSVLVDLGCPALLGEEKNAMKAGSGAAGSVGGPWVGDGPGPEGATVVIDTTVTAEGAA
jgi:hypothetical protein